MKRGIFFGLLIIMLVALPLFLACEGAETPTPKPTPAPTGSPTPTPEAHWWDKFGEPEYGGTIIFRSSSLSGLQLDPQGPPTYPTQCYGYLFSPAGDLTLDPSIHPLKGEVIEPEYYKGWLAESYEQTDPLTVIVHLREGIYWPDKPPVNGREFTADDVQYTWDRMLGTGSGFTEVNPMFAAQAAIVERVTAVDKYTVQFKFKIPGIMSIYKVFGTEGIVSPEWGALDKSAQQDWHNVAGTGPWLLSDFVSGNSLTLTANSDYWGFDERHPQNKIPYIDTLKIIQIPDKATTIAALRTGRIDMITEYRSGYLTWQDAVSLAESNPDILQDTIPNSGVSIETRCDNAPFNDIRVRKALQMALNIELIAQSHYGGYVDGKPTGLMSPYNAGWCAPYDEWPEDIKAEYAYNPEEAKKLLAEAAADGVFEPNEKGGFNTNCVFPATSDMELLQIIQSCFSDIGVEMEVQSLDFAGYRSFAVAGKHDQMIWNDSGSAIMMSPEKVYSQRSSEDLIHNYARSSDSHYDQLWADFNAADSIDECKQLCKEMDMYTITQHWTVNVGSTCIPMAWQPWIKGYNGELVMLAGISYFAAHWWVDQDIKESMGY